ncbi:MAG: ribonuclease J [Bacilli bacterium]|nr:ribonuclease J [Bacilli bacterium]
MKENDKTRFVILGGLGEIGKNMYALEHKNEIIIIDAGISFAEMTMLGIDYSIPDYTYLKEREDKIKGLFITHGHEDHIGAIPLLLQNIDVKAIYAPNQAAELIKMKLLEKNIRFDNLFTYKSDDTIKFKYFEIDFFRTTHSVPDSHGIRVKTPNGVVVTTGDFKFDLTPIGPVADLHKIARIGEEGVDLLISDSTNALNPGMSKSESMVEEALNDIFDTERNSRIIIATFASNIYRLKHIVETCYKHHRKICIFGRSMESNIDISIKGGYINHKELFISPEEANTLKPKEVCILCTGSQGEPLAALSRIADLEHKHIKLRPDDVVIFSSSPIPGNALSISRTINKLYLQGVKVYTNTTNFNIHTSGHANMEELKLMIRLLMPKYMLPFHGEYRMLKSHRDIAVMCGIPKENVFILDNGDTLNLDKHKITIGEKVKMDDIYIGSNTASNVAAQVIRDRKIMAGDGILVSVVNIDMKNKKLLNRPSIVTRGFIQVNENEELIRSLEIKTSLLVTEKLKEQTTFSDLKSFLQTNISNYITELTGRKPIILPIILDIKRIN